MKKFVAQMTLAFAGILSSVPASAVIFSETGDPHYNTTAPSGDLAGSGWELQGDTFPGVPIAPKYFITATHIGGNVGDTFSFHGIEYPIVASFVHPVADLTIWEVSGTFPEFAQLYSSSDEVGKPLVVFGRGVQRGDEVRLNGMLKGWLWGTGSNLLRWGQNVVAGISDGYGNAADSSTAFQLLRADFNSNGSPNEAHLSGGDSGGGVFLKDSEGVWKLAGINHMANKDYSQTAIGPGFYATLFDEGGFYEGELGHRQYHPDDSSAPQPGSFYATRISAYVDWIQNVINGTVTSVIVQLEESPNLLGPYTSAADAAVDPVVQTITLGRPRGTRFFRVLGDRPHLIQQIINEDGQITILYQ